MQAELPHTGAIAVFTEAALRLRVPVTSSAARQVLIATGDPFSASGIAAAGEKLGITTSVGRVPTDEETLANCEFPDKSVTLLFTRAGGFAILEKIDDGHFHVWDEYLGQRLYRSSEVQDFWDGTVFFLERTAPCSVRQPARDRAREFLRDRLATARLRLVGARALRACPILIAASALLAYVSGLSELGQLLAPSSLVLVLLLAATTVDALLVQIHSGSSASRRFCRADQGKGCGDLLSSDHAQVLGVPWAHIAMGLHAALALEIALVGAAALPLVAFSLAPALLLALRLLAVQVGARTYCRLCNTVHAINVIAVGVSAAAMVAAGDAATFDVHVLSSFALLFLVMFFAVVPLVADAEPTAAATAEKQLFVRSPWYAAYLLSGGQPIAVPPEGVPCVQSAGNPCIVLGLAPGCSACEEVSGTLQRTAAGVAEHFEVDLVFMHSAEWPGRAEALLCVALEVGMPQTLRLYNALKVTGGSNDGGSSYFESTLATCAQMLERSVDTFLPHRPRAEELVARAGERIGVLGPWVPWAAFDGRVLFGVDALNALLTTAEKHPHVVRATVAPK